MNATLIGSIVSLFAGGVIASASVIGLVSTQTAAPSESPANVESPEYNYGVTE